MAKSSSAPIATLATTVHHKIDPPPNPPKQCMIKWRSGIENESHPWKDIPTNVSFRSWTCVLFSFFFLSASGCGLRKQSSICHLVAKRQGRKRLDCLRGARWWGRCGVQGRKPREEEEEEEEQKRQKKEEEEEEEEGDRSHASEEHKQSAVVFLSFPTGRTW